MAALDLPTLETSDCLLRPWQLDDALALREACGDEDICRFTTVPQVYGQTAAVQWIKRQHAHASAGTAIVLAIIAAGGHDPVGMVGLFGLDQPERIARFGYWLIARARRRGLATCAADALAAWAFVRLGVDAIVIDCEPMNVASARVAEHLSAAFTSSRIVRADGAEVELERYTLTRIPA
jgi:RimJ/RimL family protein N-acetyltransferase